ncbi:hypothetical protein GF395_04245 [Candidatus Uhrbacteria bacterium]|nr:hypothetical protein [Candidatus Uhrbacteria bacterium]
MFNTLQDVADAMRTALEHERMAAFAQGDALVIAAQPETRERLGFRTLDALFEAIGAETGQSRRTLYNYRKVSQTFAPNARDAPVSWSVYLVAAGTDDPLAWLARAADESLSAAALRDVYKLETGRAAEQHQVERVLSTETARVMWLAGRRALMLDDQQAEAALEPGEYVQVTVWREVHNGAREDVA